MYKTQYPNMWRCGAVENNIELNKIKTSFTSCYPSYPTLLKGMPLAIDDNNVTIVTSNLRSCQRVTQPPVIAHHMRALALTTSSTTPLIRPSHIIADTGASSIFVMDTTNVTNKHITWNPISVNLPDGSLITSTHKCNITIAGLPTVLTDTSSLN